MIAEIETALAEGFERDLFSASQKSLDDKSNPLRLNNYSYAMRELTRHILHRLAPDENVLNCDWYKNETDRDYGITRKQRAYYAVQGGLLDSYVQNTLCLEVEDIHKDLVKAINNLSKLTHIEPKVFGLPDADIDALVNETTEDTVWLSLNQLADLFGRDKSVISRHFKNIFNNNELDKDSVVAKNATTALDGKTYQVEYYNLDAVISVGYRVNSARATQFRQWATARLKDYLVEGYSLNKQRLQQQQAQLKQLEGTLALFQNNLIEQANLDEAKGLVNVITDYARTFVLLNQFDSERLPTTDFARDICFEITYEQAREAINVLIKNLIQKGEATALVGNEKDNSFAGILGNIVQSFGGEYLYPSIEEQIKQDLFCKSGYLILLLIANIDFSSQAIT